MSRNLIKSTSSIGKNGQRRGYLLRYNARIKLTLFYAPSQSQGGGTLERLMKNKVTKIREANGEQVKEFKDIKQNAYQNYKQLYSEEEQEDKEVMSNMLRDIMSIVMSNSIL